MLIGTCEVGAFAFEKSSLTSIGLLGPGSGTLTGGGLDGRRELFGGKDQSWPADA